MNKKYVTVRYWPVGVSGEPINIEPPTDDIRWRVVGFSSLPFSNNVLWERETHKDDDD